jgi:pyruvate,water dikinase
MKRVALWARRALGKKRGRTLSFLALFERFQGILKMNNQVLELIAEANDKLGGDYVFDQHYVHVTCGEISELVLKLIYNLDSIAPGRYPELLDAYKRVQAEIDGHLKGKRPRPTRGFILPYNRIDRGSLDAVGIKNANLAELHKFLGIRVPEGFAITTAAYDEFIEKNALAEPIERQISDWLQGRIPLAQASAKIQEKIRAGKIPARLAKEIKSACDTVFGPHQKNEAFLALRSSAWGEDSEHSFAGQYMTKLNISLADLTEGYLEILASAFSEGVMEYRRRHGYDALEVAMSVACQQMVNAKVSGVIYSIDPLAPEKESMLLTATWGLGVPVVSGRGKTDQFTIERRHSHKVTAVNVVRKEEALVADKKGGTGKTNVRDDQQTNVCLTSKEVTMIAETALAIEKYFKKPQDIEFSIDPDGSLVILQARQLAITSKRTPRAKELAPILKKYPVIMRNQGVIAQKGIGTGKVFLLKTEEDLEKFPAGAVLVAKYASPLLAKVITKASGIITDVGSATGHMATIAREFRVPTILNTGEATTLLEPGAEITLDADENVVYQGTVHELRYYNFAETSIEETFEYRLLRRVLQKIEPLNLLDPSEKNFVPGACRSLHDITRFVHEKAVDELIDYNYYHRQDSLIAAGKLQWNIPLDMVLIDIGGGLRSEKSAKLILPDEVASVPMQALLKGIAQPGVWNNEPMSVDFGSFMSSLTRTFSPELANPKYVGQNLAIVSGEYANLSLRLGYHFTMIDSYISKNINDNYAYFRFFGGVTDPVRRSRRAKFLGEVLASNDYRVELHGDLVVARIKKLDAKSMRRRLYLLGLLVGFTRQLDVRMVSEERVAEFIQKFNKLLEAESEQ